VQRAAAPATLLAAADISRNDTSRNRTGLRRVLGIILFGIAFGYVEAAVVAYLRTIGGPVRVAAGLGAQDLFPLLRIEALPPTVLALLRIEVGREAATLIMLAGIAFAAVGRSKTGFARQEWLAAFVLAFGVWDLAFYLWLRVLIGWPSSLLTWDLLFLLPVPWAAPVLAPVIVAITMAIFGARILLSEPQEMRASAPVALAVGACNLLIAFTWNTRGWMLGQMPGTFPWALFSIGEALLIGGFLLYRSRHYRMKKAFLSMPGSTATSKKPTIISSEL
jgi:hypothetical protein